MIKSKWGTSPGGLASVLESGGSERDIVIATHFGLCFTLLRRVMQERWGTGQQEDRDTGQAPAQSRSQSWFLRVGHMNRWLANVAEEEGLPA